MTSKTEESSSFSHADRVRQLNDIDKDVENLIHSAGLAVQALTNAKPESSSSTAADGPVESRKKQFKEATQQYFAILSSVDVQLRRQYYAQAEASIKAPMSLTPAESSTESSDSVSTATSMTTTTSMATDSDESSVASAYSAINALEISWINTRKDPLNKEKEAELWAAARGFMERVQQSGIQQESEGQNGEHEKMQVD